MLEEVDTYIEEIEVILREIDRYKAFKKQFLNDLKSLNHRYEKGQIGFARYKHLKEKLLEGKTKEDNIEYFNAYILSLVRKLEYFNTQIFSVIYQEESFNKAKIIKKEKETRKIHISKGIGEQSNGGDPVAEIIGKSQEVSNKAKPGAIAGTPLELSDKPVNAEGSITEEKGISNRTGTVDVPDEVATVIDDASVENKVKAPPSYTFKGEPGEVLEGYSADDSKTPRPRTRKKHKTPLPKRKSILNIIRSLFVKEKGFFDHDEGGVRLLGILNITFIKDFLSRLSGRKDYMASRTKVEKSILDFQEADHLEFEKVARHEPNLLVKQAAQLKELLKKKHLKVYSPSILGTISNLLVRRLSIYLIDNFPDFFKRFYIRLRFANIKLLSNTYVNIMVLMSIISSSIFLIFSVLFSIASAEPLYLMISKGVVFGTFGIALMAGAMIYYPTMMIKTRKRSINTNLPFAIDHMSSLVASGVPPSKMFNLLAESKEYGEMSLEIERISNYITVFGYDLVTAVKSVAVTTPAESLKEFFDGLISTIESGGSLKNYLMQKSKEAMLAYRLERQKYVENISTYSDIYTGALIAAPLFFVSALSLVSMLGGKIGGLDVETVIAFGTYIAIPVLNVAFIVFLEFNQPEV